VLIISLIEENIFVMYSFSGKIFQDSFRTDSMFGTKFLPELEIDCVLKNNDSNITQQQKNNEIQTWISALSELQCDSFTRHFP
jgi:hypothetical protein